MSEEITSKNYVENVLKTEPRDAWTMGQIAARLQQERNMRLLHACMGASTEAGELVDVLKKHFFYGKEIKVSHLIEELGDLLWYIGLACDVLGVSMDQVMTTNIEKLRARYGEKFSTDKALNRDLQKENVVLADAEKSLKGPAIERTQ